MTTNRRAFLEQQRVDRPRNDVRSKRYRRERDRRHEMKVPSAGNTVPHSAISEKEAA